MSRPILVVRNLRKRLSDRTVLKNVSFEVYSGEIFIIRGPSGSGKSTLLRCLNRLIEPDAGDILFKGKSIFEMNPTELRRGVILVPQVPVMFDGTVKENLTFALEVLKMKYSDEDIKEIIERVGLPLSYLDKPARELSVGEQQRVSIARALMLNPEVMLMDEPTSHLDPENTRIIEDLILDLNRDRNITFVVVSHSEEQARRIGDRIGFLEDGVIRKIEVNKK